ncbi:ornithine carbamoyltransferase [Acrasis kona]|uniref:ornithine carbamoyltransferase n=1 Tax=Acrasis kona TaxID=1008807 RepID=A0AAW2ZK98_9EUKA
MFVTTKRLVQLSAPSVRCYQKKIVHLTSLNDLGNRKTVQSLIDKGISIKEHPIKYKESLSGQGILMLFQNQSMRTQISFEAGAYQLGGHAIKHSVEEEPNFEEVAKVTSRFVKCIVARLKNDRDIETLAQHSSVPVINGGSPSAHPCQALSDLMTIQQKKRTKTMEQLTACYVGAQSAQLNDLIRLCGIMRMPLRVCTGASEIQIKDFDKSVVTLHEDPRTAMNGADVVYTDLGLTAQGPTQVNRDLMSLAKEDAIILSSLPADRDVGAFKDIVQGKQSSVVYDQALNRLFIHKALLVYLLAPRFFEN